MSEQGVKVSHCLCFSTRNVQTNCAERRAFKREEKGVMQSAGALLGSSSFGLQQKMPDLTLLIRQSFLIVFCSFPLKSFSFGGIVCCHLDIESLLFGLALCFILAS